jgi:hypothetical protein
MYVRARRGRRRADQASQAGVRLLPPWQGGLVFAAWAAVLGAAGAVMTARRDIT